MMDKNVSELRKDLNQMLNQFAIIILQGEEEIVKQIDNLFANDDMDLENGKKIIKTMEEYLRIKEKLFVQQEKLYQEIAISKIV